MQTSVNLLASIWMQLAYNADVSQEVQDVYKTHMSKDTRPDLKEVSKILQGEIGRYSSVYVILDALDECSYIDRVGAIVLQELCKLQSHISLFVTSRHTPDHQPSLHNVSVLEVKAQKTDIRKYIEARIEAEPLLLSHFAREPDLRDLILDTVIERANGMYVRTTNNRSCTLITT